MNTPFNELRDDEHERLSILMEECGEVIQIIGKIFRHGYESTHPDDGEGPNNREMLETELGHIEFSKSMMIKNGDIDQSRIAQSKRKKRLKICQYLHHQSSI
jgi:NTP pyrophosphatase (non-canonical NTP hydrolase)